MLSPTLFPTGAADFLAPRPVGVTIGNYLKRMIMYDDGRFARHPRFRYFTLNTEVRWRALQVGRIYVRKHPHDAQLYRLKNLEIWLVVKGKHSLTVYCTMLSVYMEPGITGSSSGVDSLPWWIHSLCRLSSSLTVQHSAVA